MKNAEHLKTEDNLDDEFVVGSGNYLKDRGYADPEEARTKFLLANEIALAIERLGLSQRVAAEHLGMKQPDISRIVNGNLKDFAVWRLLKALSALGKDVTISVRQSEGSRGHIVATAEEEPVVLKI